jgi:polyribonucleotide nucleotidyltransferase
MTDEDKVVLLTDIVGVEDFSGDMDFKVAGTKNGVTAIQLDIKIDGLTNEIIEGTFERAHTARMMILKKMTDVIEMPRKALSQYAPKVHVVHIPTEKIGEVIGPGGKIIRNIIATTGALVDVEDDGSVMISSPNQESVDKAVTWIEGLTKEVKVGEEYEGEVKRLMNFGAFVEITPGKEGLVHVSQMATQFVGNPADVVTIGQKVKVRVIEIDEQRRINLSMLFGEDANKPVAPREHRPDSRGGGGGRPGFNRKPRY